VDLLLGLELVHRVLVAPADAVRLMFSHEFFYAYSSWHGPGKPCRTWDKRDSFLQYEEYCESEIVFIYFIFFFLKLERKNI
jgi:hypothetical protein